MPTAPTETPIPHEGGPTPSWGRIDSLTLATLILVAGVLRLWRLGIPEDQFFDEQFYAVDACYYVTGLEEPCGLTGNIIEVHPPMAKWLIGAGIEVFGYDAFGSRIAAVLAGVVLVAVTYLIARRLFARTWVAAVAGLFVALDFLLFVHSRIAMLEIFIPMFIALGFLFLLNDRDSPAVDGARRRRWWRYLAGAALGCAIATKWAAIPALGGAFALVLLWDVGRARSTGSDRPWRRAITRDGLSLVIAFALIPAAVYVLTYVGRIPAADYGGPTDLAGWLAGFWRQQVLMWDYFMIPRQLHSYTSLAWTWLSARPAYPYYFNGTGTTIGNVLAVGSPAMWIPVIPATGYALVRWMRARSSRVDVLVPLVGFGALYGLWLVPSLFGYEHFFLYYLVPAVPFMGLLVAAALIPLTRIRWGRVLASTLIASWIAMFAFTYPVLTAVQLPLDAWDARIDLYKLCPVPARTAARFNLARFFDEACRAATELDARASAKEGGDKVPAL